jgi:hypothetical protein
MTLSKLGRLIHRSSPTLLTVAMMALIVGFASVGLAA